MAEDTVFVAGSRLIDRLIVYRNESQLSGLRLNNEKLNRHDVDKDYLLSFTEHESGISILGKLISAAGTMAEA